jgi:phage shock protein PspC (stress-responsive transcriptional regulator)
MKKNISINISGIIFHIEEDGYEALRKYLDSIKRYFANFEDSSEILSDIESRIAEIFLAKLNEGKQVITAEDVSSLIATMGSVSDFKAAEEQELAGEFAATSEPKEKEKEEQSSGTSAQKEASKHLYRDQKRKILGGVCAGLGHYFNIDPVWPRLLFALLVLGSYGSLIIVYIILWIALPVSHDLEEEPSVKKMFRDRERKVIGGVASGIAAFFGADLALIRVLFVIFAIFGGLGLLVYIILWIALPEARTITEKVQMQGEPVTLSNIESTVKKSINEKEGQEESTLARIVLFPFRLIAMIIDGIARVFGPVFRVAVDVLRTFIGIVISLFGLAMFVFLIIAAGMVFGLISISAIPSWWEMPVNEMSLPLEAMRNSFPTWTIVFAFLMAFIPVMFIILIGNSIIAKRVVFNALAGWSLFVLFFISVAVLSFSIPQIVYSFKEEGEYKVEQTFDLQGKTAVLRVNEVGLDDYDVTSLTIRGYEGNTMKLVQRFEAQGNTRKAATENAQMVAYAVVQNDSVITFDSNITFKKDAKFRAQRLNMDLYVPYNTQFVIEEGMWRIIDNHYRDYDGYRDSNFDRTWRMTKEGFECLNCSEPTERKRIQLRDQFGLKDFTTIDLSGLFNVRIERGDVYAVQLTGNEREKKRYSVYLDQQTLVVEYNDKRNFFWKRDLFDDDKVKITITLPHLEELKIKGAGELKVLGFDEQDIEIKLAGAIEGDGDFRAENLTLELTGASIMELRGRGNFLEANLTGACGLRAYNYEVSQAIVEAHGASSAKVFVTDRLEIDKGVASSVSHRGDPEVINRN